MSYTEWSTTGYGIPTDNLKLNADRLRKYISQVPELVEALKADLEGYDCADANTIIEAYHGCLNVRYSGFTSYPSVAEIMAEVLLCTEGISFTPLDNYDSECFIILGQFYPWELSDTMLTLSLDALREIFSRHISILTDQSLEELEYGEWTVYNGG